MRGLAIVALSVVSVLVAPVLALASEPPADACEDFGGLDCDEARPPGTTITMTAQVQVFDGEGLDNGAAGQVFCEEGEVRLIREAVVNESEDAEARYGGTLCVVEGSVATGTQTISVPDLVPDLPAIEVHHNPHAEFVLTRLPMWFWHEGPTSMSAVDVSVDVIGGGALSGTWTGEITTWCWVVDDPREEVGSHPTRALTEDERKAPPAENPLGSPSTQPNGCAEVANATTLGSTRPGIDDEHGAAAVHTWNRRGYDTTITHWVVWEGTFTVDSAPAALPLVGLQVPTVSAVSARTTLPVRHLIPVPVPAEDDD